MVIGTTRECYRRSEIVHEVTQIPVRAEPRLAPLVSGQNAGKPEKNYGRH
jgi:hypothetical protein